MLTAACLYFPLYPYGRGEESLLRYPLKFKLTLTPETVQWRTDQFQVSSDTLRVRGARWSFQRMWDLLGPPMSREMGIL